MQKTTLLAAVLGTFVALPAFAEDAASSPVSANVTLTNNYLYRGISQTGGNPAIQGGFDFVHSSGFYIGTWGSSISWLSDSGIASNAGLELDTYAGFKNSFATDFSYDVGFLRYNYPGTYVAGVTKADTNEVYGLIGYKWVTAKYSYALGDTFGVSKAKGTGYLDISASYAIPDTGVTLGAHYGKQTYKGTTADALKAAGADPTYSDYKLSVTKDVKGYVFGLAYSKTNAKTGGFYTVNGKDLGKGTVVVSLTRTL
ncbi:MAG TPA: TorF family putative porin [Gallionellaceae bacterium]